MKTEVCLRKTLLHFILHKRVLIAVFHDLVECFRCIYSQQIFEVYKIAKFLQIYYIAKFRNSWFEKLRPKLYFGQSREKSFVRALVVRLYDIFEQLIAINCTESLINADFSDLNCSIYIIALNSLNCAELR